jgi:hypothetical protein
VVVEGAKDSGPSDARGTIFCAFHNEGGLNLMTGSVGNRLQSLCAHDLFVALVLSLLTALACELLRIPGVCGAFDDDAAYIVAAKSLVFGQGYRIISLPDAPLQTKLPIVYPALLAIIWKLWPEFPGNVGYFQLLSLFCASLTVGLSYLLLVSSGYASRKAAFLGCFICASSHLFLYFGTQALSEMPFALLLILFFISVEQQLRAPTYLREARSGILLALCCLTRTIGLFFVPGVVLINWLSYRRGWLLLLTCLTLVLPWFIWSSQAAGDWSHNPLLAYYTNYLGWGLSGLFVPRVMLYNFCELFIFYAEFVFEGLAYGMVLYKSILLNIVTLFLAPLLWLGFAKTLYRSTVLPWSILICAAALVIWPTPPIRLIVPFLPLLLSLQIQGVEELVQTYKARKCLQYCFYLLLAGGIAANAALLPLYQRHHAQTRYPGLQIYEKSVRWSEYEQVFAWIKEHTKDNDVLATVFDPMVYLYTGRRSINPYIIYPLRWYYGAGQPYGSAEEIRAILDQYQADYLVLLAMPFDRKLSNYYALLEELRALYPGALTEVFQGSDKRFRIYRVERSLLIGKPSG